MSERPLPLNLSDWPANPHQLLGVSHPYGARELKKAYTRLIRFYKPELHPAEFARIREAYDRLLPWAMATDSPKQVEEELPAPREEAPPVENEGMEILPPPQISITEKISFSDLEPATPRTEDPSQEPEQDGDYFWQLATRGETESAYRGLTEEAARHSSVERNYLRLYWLLSVHKELDSQRHPADWLARGLSATGGSQRLLETYVTFINMQPLEANNRRCVKILEGLRDPYQVSYLVQNSWRQLLQFRRWNDVLEQFPIIRERLKQSTDAWLGLVRTVADAAGWETTSLTGIDLMKACLRELDDLSYVALQKPEVFDRIDFLKTLVKSADAVNRDDSLRELCRLVRKEWTTDLDNVRIDLHRLIADIACYPNRWSNRFDDAVSAVNPLACQAYHLVNQLRSETGADMPLQGDAEKIGRIQRQLTPVLHYPQYRETIYRYCLETFTPPESLIDLLSPRYAKKFPQDNSLEEHLLGDWPLRLICLAHRFYHS
ncbi:hypothetical protein [Zavarzinella formosa]|uniref:hypothetical protein n=1 Tax=Zavarzinella formosa TaxID=360055 RepID=UPI00030B2B90|nr:hypothetical protein [Zavarzinella formosa]